MLTKYRIKGRFKEAKIEVVEVLRETEHFVYTRGHRDKENRDGKKTEWAEYYDTWEQAHEALTKAAQERVAGARRSLELANAFAGNVKGMRKPSSVSA